MKMGGSGEDWVGFRSLGGWERERRDGEGQLGQGTLVSRNLPPVDAILSPTLPPGKIGIQLCLRPQSWAARDGPLYWDQATAMSQTQPCTGHMHQGYGISPPAPPPNTTTG